MTLRNFLLPPHILLAFAAFMPWAETASAGPMVSVSEYSFSSAVVNLEPVGLLSDPAQLKKGESLHLWLKIQINPSGLKYLRALGRLPVYIRWGRDGWLTDPPIDVGITSRNWQASQAGIGWKALQGGGSFVWRTHANKATPINGRYYASLLDANKKVITSIDFPTEPMRPEISVSH